MCYTCLSCEFPIFLIYREKGYMMGYLLSDRGGTGGVWKTSFMEISAEGNHRVAVKAHVNADWDGLMAFTNVLLEDHQCTEGVILFFSC